MDCFRGSGMNVSFAIGRFPAAVVAAALMIFQANATSFRLDAPKANSGNGNSASAKNHGNGNGNSDSGDDNSSSKADDSSLFGNLFVGGRGSYEGGVLLGETLQSHNNPILKNSGSASELAWVESLVTGALPTLPSVSAAGPITVNSDGSYSFEMAPTWDYAYIMAKWGAAHNESDHAVWYVSAGEVLNFELPNGLSHATLWAHTADSVIQPVPEVNLPPNPTHVEDGNNQVPVDDTGATWTIFASGLLLLVLFRRAGSGA